MSVPKTTWPNLWNCPSCSFLFQGARVEGVPGQAIRGGRVKQWQMTGRSTSVGKCSCH